MTTIITVLVCFFAGLGFIAFAVSAFIMLLYWLEQKGRYK